MIIIIFLCIMKSHLFAMFVWNFTTTSLSSVHCLDIAFYKKDGRKLPSPTLPINSCVALYATSILTSALSVCYFCINKNKMIISKEDRMLIKVLHQEKGYSSKKLLAEFPNKALELITTVFIVLETCVFIVSYKRLKNSTTQETQFIEILHTVRCLNKY